ncbi:rab-like protein 3 isoform X1 [Asterias rubens]|uniref:rab-like protein 3 isoform X1 n=1 Tax=Asterias rubens TaxID=7604 RepID=UPI00145529A1|nr:rab-like protein 3 isoform X1 [Asterias rubens]
MASVDLEKVRVVVVGDSGVGKSSLVTLICRGQPNLYPSWTIGAAVDVKIHEYKEGTPAQKSYFVECWDIGGSVNHANSRHIFYNPVNGIILVHDLTNRKSHSNLRLWLSEVLSRESTYGTRSRTSTSEYDPEQFAGTRIPVLVVGTKHDQLDSTRQTKLQTSVIAEECGADEINLDCTLARHVAPGSTNAVKLSRFFDKVIYRRFYTNPARDSPQKVIERRFFSRDSSQQPVGSPTEKRRPFTPQFMKNLHTD